MASGLLVRASRPCLLGMILVMAGCSTTPGPEITPVGDPSGEWRQRVARLGAVDSWVALGKLAVKAPEDSFTASMQWRQGQETYRIRLVAPLSQGTVEISGKPGHVDLRTSSGEAYGATHPDQLLYQRMGWRVPLTGLRYWIMGRPHPTAKVEVLNLDAAGRLQSLEQSGWRVTYLSYGKFDELELPTKVTLENARVSAQLVVRHWSHRS